MSHNSDRHVARQPLVQFYLELRLQSFRIRTGANPPVKIEPAVGQYGGNYRDRLHLERRILETVSVYVPQRSYCSANR